MPECQEKVLPRFLVFRERFEKIGKKIKREADAWPHQMAGIRRPMSGPHGTLNTITPCAACKLLRRRCAQECPFSPYFSPHEPHKFASVHKVFGASNVSKMLMEVPENQRADAANSLVYEANVRLRDPVYGCMGAISALQHQIQALQAEVTVVRSEILKYNQREAVATLIVPSNSQVAGFHNSGGVSVIAPRPQTPSTPPLPTAADHPPPPSSCVFSQPTTRPLEYRDIESENNSYFG
ncbi:LOB domain-containing protein 15 [Hirschfeldia incana]|nr:LOB domain-containing protein 15 [Hirschfeldia incana]